MSIGDAKTMLSADRAVGAARAETPTGPGTALIVAVQSYLDAHFVGRTGSLASARRLTELLTRAGWAVTALLDDESTDRRRPLMTNLLAEIDALTAAPGPRLLVIAGALHEGRFVPRDGRHDRLDRTSVSLDELLAAVGSQGAVIIDAPSTPPVAPIHWGLGLAEGAGEGPGLVERLGRVGDSAAGRALSLGELEEALASGSAAWPAARLWRVGPVERPSLAFPTIELRSCKRCEAPIEDPAAAFCPACGAALDDEIRIDGGRYRLTRQLGQGGMGQVFLAEDTRLNVQRAVKLLSLPAELPPEEVEGLRARLLQEARAAQSLGERTHHVVRVFDVGYSPERGEPFLVMELLEGETLSARLARSRMSVDEAVSLCRTIAHTVAVAHAQGMIHRDLKPDNVMLIRRDDDPAFVKLLDFGLAKMDHADVRTVSGRVMGTLQYMPPEQLRGERVDARADVFALGAVLFECLTGERAVAGRTQRELFRVLLDTGVPSIATKRDDLPPHLVDLVDRCLSLDRAARPADASEVVVALGGTPPASRTGEQSARLRLSEIEVGATLPPSSPALTRPTPRAPDASAASAISAPTDPGHGVDRSRGSRTALFVTLGLLVVSAVGVWLLTRPTEPDPSEPPVGTRASAGTAAGTTVPGATPVLDAALAAPSRPDAQAAPPADAAPIARPSRPRGPWPQQAHAAGVPNDGGFRYSAGADAAERWASLAADALLGTGPPAPTFEAAGSDPRRARWSELPAEVRAWLAGLIPTETVTLDHESLSITADGWAALRALQVKPNPLRGVGEWWSASARVGVVARSTCGDARPGDRVVGARWTLPGYGGGSCAGADCPVRVSRALQQARSVAETLRLSLTVARVPEFDGPKEAGEPDENTPTVETSCAVRP